MLEGPKDEVIAFDLAELKEDFLKGFVFGGV